ncbi:hypothetical protein U1Q18_026508 [Sarracenia purpurea var. burkii]
MSLSWSSAVNPMVSSVRCCCSCGVRPGGVIILIWAWPFAAGVLDSCGLAAIGLCLLWCGLLAMLFSSAVWASCHLLFLALVLLRAPHHLLLLCGFLVMVLKSVFLVGSAASYAWEDALAALDVSETSPASCLCSIFASALAMGREGRSCL